MTTETGIEKDAVSGPGTPSQGATAGDDSVVPGGEKGRILAAGFGTTVAMWAIGYITHMPSVSVPQWLTVALLGVILVLGGFRAAKSTGEGLAAGVKTGLLSSLLNLLVLGSLLGGDEPGAMVPSAAVMIPGFLAAGALLGGIGGMIRGKGVGRNKNGTGALAGVGAMATLLLLVAGGIVTSQQAGLAVVDWPNSFGYNMFLYPLSRMSGGVFYEHAHRLLGSLVGITTFILAYQIFRVDRRGWVKAMSAVAVIMVIIQGIMGGLRVTGKPTLSTAETDMAPSIELAVAHGVTGQVFFGLMVALTLVLSTRWFTNGPAKSVKSAGTERTLSLVLLIFIVIQIALGAVLRHMAGGLLSHIGMSVIVLGLAVFVGMRALSLYEDVPRIKKTGVALLGITGFQFLLGFAALAAVGVEPSPGGPTSSDLWISTLHQAVGAILLAHAVMLYAWTRRAIEPAGDRVSFARTLSILGAIAAGVAASGTPSPTLADGFNLGAGEFGLGLGNTVRHTGIRLNAIDQNVERVNGLNFTLWRPGENHDLVVTGIGAGIVGPDGADLRGIMLGGYGVNAERVTGIALGLLALGIDDMRGIALAPIGAGFGGMTGIAIGGFFAGGAEMGGITIGGLGAGGVKMHGITIGGLAILADQIRGAGITLGYLKAREQRGVSIALFNRAQDLQGLQIGLLNHAANNPVPFRWLPLLNLHID